MSRLYFSTNPKAKADQSSMENDRTPYTSNVTTAPYTLSDRSMRQPGSSLTTDTLGVAEKSKVAATNYIYYRIYAEDRAIPSKRSVVAGDPFLGCIKARSVPPPSTVKAVKRSIAEVENIKCTNTTIFLTPYSQSPMGDAEKVTILNGTGPGSTPQEPLALVAKVSDSERSAFESEVEGRGGHASAAKPDTAFPEIRYVFYRIYAEDGAIPSKTCVTRDDPFLGRIKVISVPPPRTAKTVKCSIATEENIKDGESISLFLTPYSKSPMDDANKDIILNRTGTGPGSTPQEPLALVAKMLHSERNTLDSEGKSGLASAAEPDTTIRYVYYLLYGINNEMPSKVAFDIEEPSLGRIRADSIAPPHTPTSIKQCISRVEGNPALAWHTDLFADTSSDTPLQEGHISILSTDCPGLSPSEPMAIVEVKNPSIPDGKYVIKNRATDIYWNAWSSSITTVYFCFTKMKFAKKYNNMQWDISQDANGNISMTSPYAPFSWAGVDMTGSAVPVPWRLIPVDNKFYYITTDMNRLSQNPRVPAAQEGKGSVPGSMATLKEGDQRQMWEFIPIEASATSSEPLHSVVLWLSIRIVCLSVLNFVLPTVVKVLFSKLSPFVPYFSLL